MSRKNERDLLSGDEEEQKKQWVEEISRQPFFTELAEQYNSGSINCLLKQYADRKYDSLKYLGHVEVSYDRKQTCWVDAAQGHLELILQKKLFDLQCRWRAEQIQLPGIEVCYDFKAWEHDVFNCPFLEPIGKDDLDLYIRYLQHPDADPDYRDAHVGMDSWQDYDGLCESREENYAIPEWYEYHNQYTGAGNLLALPDIRGTKEKKYTDLTFELRRKELETDKKNPYDKRPWINDEQEETILEKILAFESPLIRRAYKLRSWNIQRSESEEYINEMISHLLEADEPVPIEAHSSWLEALKLTYRRYQCRMIAGCLPHVYGQYCMNLQMGIAFTSEDGGIAEQQWLRDQWRSNVLTGRKLAGEQEDLDF